MWIRSEKGDLFNLTHLQRIEVLNARSGVHWIVQGSLCWGNSVDQVEVFKHRSREEAERVRDQIARRIADVDQLLDINDDLPETSATPITASTT